MEKTNKIASFANTAVIVRDTDAGECVPCVTFYKDAATAIAKAKKICGIK